MSKLASQDILCYIDSLLKYSNYSRAAQSLYISQPYLTKVIKKIEIELGCELITRNKLPYRLTEQGKIYYQYLTSLEHSYAKLMREISYVSDMGNKVLRIGILPSLGAYLTPLFYQLFWNFILLIKLILSRIYLKKMRNVSKIMSWTSGSDKIQAVSP